jgi:hypothetical protein
MVCTVAGCQVQPGDGITLCHDHTSRLERDLDEIPGILTDLWDTTIRATHYTDPVTAASGEPALIVDFKASATGHELAALIRSWTSMILDHGVPTKPGDMRSPASCAKWLRKQGGVFRAADWAGDMCDEFHAAVWEARRGTDKPPSRVFAGMCPTDTSDVVCGAPLYARVGSGVAHCRSCGGEWDVQSWRFEALLAAGMETGTSTQVSRMLTDPVTGEALPSATIRKWVSRGLLRHVNEQERWLAEVLGQKVPQKRYQVRKVRNLWVRMKASKYGNPMFRTSPMSTGHVA